VSAISFRASRARRSSAKSQQPRAGGGFQHEVGRGQSSRFGGGEAERDRRRELLEVLGFLGPARLRRQPFGKTREHPEHRGGRARARAHRAAEFAQEQHLRRLERLVSVFPYPRAFRVRAAERGLHGGTQGAGIEGAALAEQLREQGRGVNEARHLVGRGLGQEQRERSRGRRSGGGGRKHGEDLREQGRGNPAGRSLFSVRVHPLPATLFLSGMAQRSRSMKKARRGEPSVCSVNGDGRLAFAVVWRTD
jgi:hypothetical protein